ncbi:hypothetical protein ACWD4N_47045, partial [Streptomyces sp. NPDC002586]
MPGATEAEPGAQEDAEPSPDTPEAAEAQPDAQQATEAQPEQAEPESAEAQPEVPEDADAEPDQRVRSPPGSSGGPDGPAATWYSACRARDGSPCRKSIGPPFPWLRRLAVNLDPLGSRSRIRKDSPMKSLTEQDIRNSFINCSKGEAKR